MIGDNPRVMRVENQTPPTLSAEPIVPQIHVPVKKKDHTNYKYATVNFTGRRTDVAPPPYLYPTWRIFIEATNNIATVTKYEIFCTIKLKTNSVIYPETDLKKSIGT